MVKNNLFNRYSFLKMTFLLSVFQVLISCDRMVPPIITNGYKYDIIINITYNNKSQTKVLLSPNVNILNRQPGKSLEHLQVYSVNMELIAEYDSKYIDKKRADLVDNEYWVVTEKDLYIVPRKNYFDGKWQEYIKSKPQ